MYPFNKNNYHPKLYPKKFSMIFSASRYFNKENYRPKFYINKESLSVFISILCSFLKYSMVICFLSSLSAKAEISNHSFTRFKDPIENLSIISDENVNKSKPLIAQNNSYSKVRDYFAKRKRPLHHFLDIGIGVTILESIYPFKTTAWPLFVYLNYRREKWGQMKLPIMLSLQYEPLLKPAYRRVSVLTGIRYPKSHDLNLFHVDLMLGISFPLSRSVKKDNPAMELKLLFTHIIGPKAAMHRLYFQWGTKARVKSPFQPGLIVHLGLDSHL